MIRLTWRQARPNLATSGAILLAITLMAVLTENSMNTYIHSSGLATCVSPQTDCGALGDQFQSKFGFVMAASQWLIFVPLLIGVFWGGPVLAREIEQGTHRLAWTQSVSRGRWLATRLGLYLLGAVVMAAIIAGVTSWWLRPLAYVRSGGTVGPSSFDRINPNMFNFVGIAPIAYTLFAFAAGAAAGAITRKVVPSMLVSLALLAPLRVWVQLSRGHLLKPMTVTFPLGDTVDPRSGLGDWVLDRSYLDPAGHAVAFPPTSVEHCLSLNDASGCLSASGYRIVDTYQPLSRFWPLQFAESGIFVGAALVCLAVAVWWTLRRVS